MASLAPAFDLAPFQQIDRIVAGVGYADHETSRYIQCLQNALSESMPLSLRIADRLTCLRGKSVYLFTGFVVPRLYPRGENDGPLGTIALARALDLAGLVPTVWVDPQLLDDTLWLAAELGIEIPIRPIEADGLLLTTRPPVAAIAVEKPGRNSRNIMHTFDGIAIESGSIPIDEIIARWNGQGVLTIGIGDRGNEIGFGKLRDTVIALRPETAGCRCGCGGGVVSNTFTQLFLPAAVSNWGAYGIAAAMAILTKSDALLLQPDEEARLLQVAAVRGCVDGVLRRGGYGVDGLSGQTSVALVRELQRISRRAIKASSDTSACA